MRLPDNPGPRYSRDVHLPGDNLPSFSILPAKWPAPTAQRWAGPRTFQDSANLRTPSENR